VLPPFAPTEAYARALDEADPLRGERAGFVVPPGPDGTAACYLCGNSLGLQPARARAYVEQELEDWARLAVDAHLHGRTPWYSYHEVFTETGARLVGGRPGEVVMMNGLTVNLHLLLRSFFRPEGARRRILVESPAFPSDLYAVQTHLRTRGLDPDGDLIEVAPPRDRPTLETADFAEALERADGTVALMLVGGVNFLTGQLLDLPGLVEVGRRHGCVVGLDLAHAAGNVPLALHDWDVDFAAWCSYKYLNAGPGAVAGVFVHERHARDVTLPRYGGWWGNDPATRFNMASERAFVPRATAEGWQLSNPPILAMAPLRASLEIFDRVGTDALRAKSRRLTGYLRTLLERLDDHLHVVTPDDEEARGCQLSIVVRDPRDRLALLGAEGVVVDFREPDVLRAAPVPLYNTFHDAWRFATTLARVLGADPIERP
jgi:kynureninase